MFDRLGSIDLVCERAVLDCSVGEGRDRHGKVRIDRYTPLVV